MGKGARKHEQQERRRAQQLEAAVQARKEARKMHRIAVVLCVLTLLFLAVTAFFQILAIHSLATAPQTEAVAAKIPLMVLLGSLGFGLIAVGTLAASVPLFARRPKWAILGAALAVIGAVLFAAFIGMLAECFPYHDDGIRATGLDFNKLFSRHGVVYFFVPPLFAALVLAFRAAKKREVAELMDPTEKPSSTLALDD